MSVEDLTPRELEILAWRARGLTYAAVGVELGVSSQTVKNTLRVAFAKIGVSTGLEAFAALGWLMAPEPHEARAWGVDKRLLPWSSRR